MFQYILSVAKFRNDTLRMLCIDNSLTIIKSSHKSHSQNNNENMKHHMGKI